MAAASTSDSRVQVFVPAVGYNNSRVGQSDVNVYMQHTCRSEGDDFLLEETSQVFGDIKCQLKTIWGRDECMLYCTFDSVHSVQYWYCKIESSSLRIIQTEHTDDQAGLDLGPMPLSGFYDTYSDEKLILTLPKTPQLQTFLGADSEITFQFTARGACFPTEKAAIDFSNAELLFSDLVLQFNGHEDLYVHKLTLSQVSDVFCEMFVNLDAQQKNKNTDNDDRSVIAMPDDVDYDSFVRMLYHIYPQSLMPLNMEYFEDTLAMADRYDVSILLGKCDQFLASSENPMPLHDCLLQADRYGRQQVVAWCLDKLDSFAFQQLRSSIDLHALSKSTIIKLLTIICEWLSTTTATETGTPSSCSEPTSMTCVDPF